MGLVDLPLANHTIRVLTKKHKIMSRPNPQVQLLSVRRTASPSGTYLFHFEGPTIEVVLVDLLHCFLHQLFRPELNNTDKNTFPVRI